jgi:hypothetical protein
MILPCTCTHAYQDKVYGKGMRVHNEGTKCGQGGPGYRCTVCSATKKKG